MSLENLSSGFPTRSDTIRAVQQQKMARGLKFAIRKKRDCTFRVVKTNMLMSYMYEVNPELICTFVIAYAKSWFSHDAALMSSTSRFNIKTKKAPNQLHHEKDLLFVYGKTRRRSAAQ